ncbi:MAG: protease modulator HflC [Clostridiales bacterium]|nr:protease modulator HflC [Clostridiales bacterium]
MNNNNFNSDNIKNIEDALKNKAQQFKSSSKKMIKYGSVFFVLLILLGSLGSFVYIVAEDEVATVTQFGKISKVIVDKDNVLAEEQNKLIPSFSDIKIIKDKGLFFKIPFITQVQKDTSKLITYISNSANINTQDKLKYEIAMYAQWEITHPGLFRSSLGTYIKANSVIDEIGYAAVIEKINSLTSQEFLTDKEKLNEVLQIALTELNEDLALKGIALVDIEVYRTILPPSNVESTYNKMIAEREAIAEQKRAEGLELYQNTVADTDKNVATIIADSIEVSEKIIGEADATALEIYANAFSIDPGFYEFWRSLQSYENAFDENTVIYLDRNNAFLKYFSGN